MASVEQPISNITAKMPADPRSGTTVNFFKADLLLRLLLLVAAVGAPVVMITGNQTVTLNIPFLPFPMTLAAKYNYSPALIYFVVASLVASLYSLLTAVVSALSISKPSPQANTLFILACFDVVMLGVVASAAGAGASVAYVGLKGNSHIGWMQICNIYGSYCRHVGASLLASLVASFTLILLVIVSAYSLYRRTTNEALSFRN